MTKDILNAQLKRGRLADAGYFPNVILIDTVSFCNLRCSMCFHSKMTRKKGIMPWKLFTKIIDEIAMENKDARVWMVFFGEALILKNTRPSIFDMIRYAKDKGLTDVVLNSNANIMDPGSAQRLIEAGLDAIYIGVDAFSSEVYSKLRIGGDYNKTVDNILGLLKLIKDGKFKNPKVYLQFVVMEINKNEQEDFKRFWTDKGAIVKIRPKVSWAGKVDAPDQVLDNKDRWPCHWAMQTFSVTDAGLAVLCPCDLDARFTAGDVKKETIRDVWNGRLKKLRNAHQNRQFELLPDMCSQCRDWQSARSDYYSQTD